MPLTVAQCKTMLAHALKDERLSALWEGIRNQGDDAPEGCGRGISVLCRVCGDAGPEGTARAYVEAPPIGMVLCANRLNELIEVQDALRHELTHAYDMCERRLDLTKCSSLAYSEVRAAREAECRLYRDTAPFNSDLSFFKMLKESCVRSRATRATKALFPNEGGDCVTAAFAEALADLSPHSGTSSSSSHLATGSSPAFSSARVDKNERESSSSRSDDGRGGGGGKASRAEVEKEEEDLRRVVAEAKEAKRAVDAATIFEAQSPSERPPPSLFLPSLPCFPGSLTRDVAVYPATGVASARELKYFATCLEAKSR